jgi:hypothetical protein
MVTATTRGGPLVVLGDSMLDIDIEQLVLVRRSS